MLIPFILLYIVGIFLNFIYLVETIQVSNSEQRMVMFCCSLVYPIYVVYLIQRKISYFTLSSHFESNESATEKLKVNSLHYGFNNV